MSLTLVDLDSQAEEVARYVKGWKPEAILSWLRQYGTIEKVANPYDNNLYLFTSSGGIETGLSISEEGELTVIRQHTTYRPK